MLMQQVESLLKKIGAGDKNDPMPKLVQCVVLTQWAAAEASNAVETEEAVVRRLEGDLAVARSQVSMAHSMQQWWGEIMEYAEVGRELMQEEWDV
jgi:hypothetical protein